MATATDDQRIIEFDVRTDEMLVNMGPQHPSTHGVLRLVLRTDGEVVSETTPHIGYLHRCAEKIGENLTPRQWIPYTDRMDYLAGMNMNLGWALTVEKLLKYEMPERGKHLRVIIAEMGRIASHLVGMGAYGLDLGTFSPFLYAFREREKILDLFEEACGARLTYSYITVGGATADLPPGWLQRCEKFLDELEPVIADYHALLTTNAIFVRRTAAVGVLSPEMAISYGCTGPVLRGSGVDQDLRRDGEERYTEMYDGYAFEVVVEKNGHYPKDHTYPPVPAAGDLRRQLAPILCADAGSCAVDGPGAASDRPIQPIDRLVGRAGEADREIAQGGSVFGDGMPTRTDGLLYCQRRGFDSVAGAGAEQFVLQSVGDTRIVQRLFDCGCAGNRRIVGRCDGGN